MAYLQLLCSNAMVIVCIEFCCWFSFLIPKKKKTDLLMLPYIPEGNAGDVTRFALYLKLLKEKNISYRIHYPCHQSTFNNVFVTGSNKKKQYHFYRKLFWKRFLVVLSAGQFKSVYAQRGLFPFYPDQHVPYLSKLLRKLNRNIVLDFYDPDYLHNEKLVHAAAKLADKITVANKELFDHFNERGHKTFLHPLAIDCSIYKVKTDFQIHGVANIFWTGNYENSLKLLPLVPVLKKISLKIPLRLSVICQVDAGFDKSICVVKPWHPVEFFNDLASADIALYPVGGNLELEKSKTAFKPLEYAAAKIPMVASPLGLTQFFENENEVLLANNIEDWESQIMRLLQNESLRKHLAENSNAKVKLHHDYHHSFEQLLLALEF